MSRFSRPPIRMTGVVTAAVAALACTSCGSSRPPAHCVDEQGRVVSNEHCDTGYRGGGGALFFIYAGGRYAGALRQGTQLTGGRRISPTDAAGRASLGLPRSGGIGGSRGGFGTPVRGGSRGGFHGSFGG